jgi:hypothetical protein
LAIPFKEGLSSNAKCNISRLDGLTVLPFERNPIDP